MTVHNRHWVRIELVPVVIELLQDARYQVRVEFPHLVPFENGLHHVVADWVENSREDFWLTIDHDNPPMRNPLDLAELDLDVVGCPTPVWYGAQDRPGERPIYWNAYDWKPEEGGYKEHSPHEGLQRVDAVGTGCVLFARRVFDDHPELREAPFRRETDEWGRVTRGNDLSFAHRARAEGIQFWAHYDYPCRHFREVDLARAWEYTKSGCY